MSARIIAAYGWEGSLEPLGGGLINDSYRVVGRDGRVLAVLQRLHPVFAPEVNLDLEAVTRHLAAKGLETPLLIRSTDGSAWIEEAGRVWRAISHVDGETRTKVSGEDAAESAGELVGRFHRALDDLRYSYASVRTGVHDTPAHLAKLTRLVDRVTEKDGDDDVALAKEILDAFAGLPAKPSELPRRHAHGDLKISNVLFQRGTPRARCLIDLDTCGRLELAYELGDMLRSWCNASGEDTSDPHFSAAVYQAALRGYARGSCGLLRPEEVASLGWGLEAICIELAARFCADVFEDSYFGWDSRRFASRQDHNRVRARGQLALARLVARERAPLAAIARAAFGGRSPSPKVG